MSFIDWYRQHLYLVMLDHSTNPRGLNSSGYGSGPPGTGNHLCQLAFRRIVPVEGQCINPSILQPTSGQPGQRGDSSFSDHAVEGDRVLEDSYPQLSPFPAIHDSAFNGDPRNHGPMVSYEDSSGVGEAPAYTEVRIDEEFFMNPETREMENLDDFFSDIPEFPEPVDIDGHISGTAGVAEPMETDKDFFEHADIQELVNIHDDFSKALETSDRMDIDYSEERKQVVDCSLPWPAPSSPLSPPPLSPVPQQPGDESAVYLVESIVQAWGPKHRRQYLIRWEGWGPEFDSWEPACNVSAELRAEFETPRHRRRHPWRRS